MMENENKRFANISISFFILFIMKLIAQINVLFFPKLKVLILNIYMKEISVAITICVKIPSLLPSILDRSVAFAKPMNIYIGVGITVFPITCHLEKRQCECNNVN